MKLSQLGVFDGTFPVARFARARMAERLIPELKSESRHSSSTGVNPMMKQDLLSKFIAAREARPEFMTDALVQTMAVSMAFAGSETTAISLSAVFYYLLRNPKYYERLRQELDEAAASGKFSDYETGLVTFAEAQKLPYLHACIQEAFRMHPAAGLPLERVVPPQGAEIAGHHIKGGTIVGCSAWLIHRRPEIFGPNVDLYNPKRWLPDPTLNFDEESERIKRMNGMMFQFGMGSRTCIGKNISLLEIYKVVPSLLRRFHVSTPTVFPLEGAKRACSTGIHTSNIQLVLERRVADSGASDFISLLLVNVEDSMLTYLDRLSLRTQLKIGPSQTLGL